MSNFILSTESVADVNRDFMTQNNIRYICFRYMLDDEEFIDNLGEPMSYEEFYQRLRDGAEPRTSQVNISEYLDYFTKILQEGKDILHVCLSSGLSSTFNSACQAAEIARERFPNQRIFVVDSLMASCGIALICEKLAEFRDQGKSAEEVYNWIEENKLYAHAWFFSSDLTFFIKNGRVSRLAGAFGGVLNICPVMEVDMNGYLKPRMKVRGRKMALNTMLGKMLEDAQDGLDYKGGCFISSSDSYDDASALASLVTENFKNINHIPIYSIGTTIGSHAGPGTVALFYWGSKRIV